MFDVMQMKRFKNIRDVLVVAILWMEKIANVKSLADVRDVPEEELCFRLCDIIASLELSVKTSWFVYVGVSPPLSEYWNDDETTEDVADTKCAEENDVDWEEILDHRMN
jgi:hypothetical protein